MSQELFKPVADSTVTLSIGSGLTASLMHFLNVNAAGLGVLVSLLGVTIAATFYFLSYQKNKSSKMDKAYIQMNHKRIEELEAQVKILSNKQKS